MTRHRCVVILGSIALAVALQACCPLTGRQYKPEPTIEASAVWRSLEKPKPATLPKMPKNPHNARALKLRFSYWKADRLAQEGMVAWRKRKYLVATRKLEAALKLLESISQDYHLAAKRIDIARSHLGFCYRDLTVQQLSRVKDPEVRDAAIANATAAANETWHFEPSLRPQIQRLRVAYDDGYIWEDSLLLRPDQDERERIHR